MSKKILFELEFVFDDDKNPYLYDVRNTP